MAGPIRHSPDTPTPAQQRLADVTRAWNAMLDAARNEGRKAGLAEAMTLLTMPEHLTTPAAIIAELQTRLHEVPK